MKIRQGTIPLQDVKFEMKIYPREHYQPAIAQQYADALINGAQFPPIVLEEGTNRLLDGKHRLEAYKLYQEMHQRHQAEQNGQMDLWPEPTLTIPCEWHVVPDGETPKLYALSFQQKHGLRASPGEAQAVAREQYKAFPGTPLSKLAARIGVPQRTLNDWLKDLLHRHEEERQAVILRLDHLGWTQEEIATVLQRLWPEAHGISQDQVSRILREMAKSPICVKADIDRLGIEETVKRYNLPEILVWALKLQGLSDQERVAKAGLDITIQPYDVWQWAKADPRFGLEYPGRLPGQLLIHLLYFFSSPGDTVLDPMAGGGTTVDACLAMGRHCYAYDIEPCKERYDILPHDLRQGWPDRLKKADLVIWDPPYYAKKVYADNSISKLSREDYLKFFAQAFRSLHESVPTRSHPRLAFVMSDWNDEATPENGIFIWHYLDLMRQSGLRPFRHIQVPLSTQQVHAGIKKRFEVKKRLARLERYVILAYIR